MSNELLEPWPYSTADVPPIAALYKRAPEDFVVEEIPAYSPSGEGTHVYLTLEKRGLTTQDVVRRIARTLGVRPREVGYAGLKDAQGVTRQTFSVEHVDPALAQQLARDDLRVIAVSRHGNKLRVGHLRGNRFTLKLRELESARIQDVERVLETLALRGVPNYFGEQRFGARGDSWEIGRALLAEDHELAARLIAGDPRDIDRGAVKHARMLYDQGEFEKAARAWPGGFRDCIRLCGAMAKKKGDARRALHAVDRALLSFYVSAWQSWLFNRVVAERIGSLDRVMPGDLAWKHANGAVFKVLDADVEAPRAASFEISPTGPLFGPRMTEPEGEPAAIERRVLEQCAVSRESFDRRGPLQPPGGRRPLRFRLEELAHSLGRDEVGDYFELRFVLDSGCYATAVLREIGKTQARRGNRDGSTNSSS